MLPNGPNWPYCLGGSLKSHLGISISLLFLWYPNQVSMKNVFKTFSDFFCYLKGSDSHFAFSHFLIVIWFQNLSFTVNHNSRYSQMCHIFSIKWEKSGIKQNFKKEKLVKLADYGTIGCDNLSTVGIWGSEMAKKVFKGFDSIFHVYLIKGLQKYQRNWIPTVAFWATTKISKANPAHRACFCPC